MHAGVDNAVAMVEVAKIDVAIAMGGDNGFNRLIVQPEIKSYADLRGKTVIVDAPDTAFAFLMYEMLRKNGLNKGDYEVRPVGASFRRFEVMLKDKTAAAAMLNMPFTLRATSAGLGDLGSAVAALGPYQGTGSFVLRSWASANSDVLVRYYAGLYRRPALGRRSEEQGRSRQALRRCAQAERGHGGAHLGGRGPSDRRADARRGGSISRVFATCCSCAPRSRSRPLRRRKNISTSSYYKKALAGM